MRSEKIDTIAYLRKLIGHDNWFISGSYAQPNIKYPNDIDIFFHTKRDFTVACDNCQLVTRNSITTHNALTFSPQSTALPVQFVKKHFGSVTEIFDTFDLNVCKYAVYPNGTHYYHFTAQEPLYICKIDKETFNRYLKYLKYLSYSGEKPTLKDVKHLIDSYISDTNLLEDYYNDRLAKTPVNHALFDAFKCVSTEIRQYLTQQAIIYAPELLI